MRLNFMQETILKGHEQYKTFVVVTARRMGKTYLMNMLAENYLRKGEKVLRIGSGLNQSRNSILGKDFDVRLFDEPCTIRDFEQIYQYSYGKKTLIIGSPDLSVKYKPSFFKFLYETYPSVSFPFTTTIWNMEEYKKYVPKDIFESEYLCKWRN